MYLAYDTNGCDGGLDFWGMFSDPVGSMIGMVGKIVMAGALAMFGAISTSIGTDNVAASDKISGSSQWVVIYLSIGSLLFAAAKMALDRRGEAGTKALKGLLRVVVVSAAATTVIDVFAVLMDRYGNYLLTESMNEILGGIGCTDAVPGIVLLIVGCLLTIAAVIQMVLLWIRLGVMVMLMGTLPMAAAASMTDWGTQWWRKHIGWMVAWLLYKPAVGMVMYTGAVLMNDRTGDQINTQMAGMAILLLSAIALPALLRLVVPATAALGGDSVGSATMSVAGGIASGAKSLAQGATAMGGPRGSQGPSGADGGGGPSGSSGSSGSDGGGHRDPQDHTPGKAAARGAASTGGGSALGGAAAGALGAATIVAGIAKGAANIAKSGVEGANQNNDHGGS
ncbi:hypothetical protein [Streptomyces sp. NPDC048277]|uniref:hypothetical protein n=1 Tax=Streptomyces sp. NPDC048277 TaxID=3155027 RepID=UPI0033ED9B07